jgi:hypothetical protein
MPSHRSRHRWITVYLEGFADISCTFVLERDIEGARRISAKVSAAINRLPPYLAPVITGQDLSPTLLLLYRMVHAASQLTEIADKQIAVPSDRGWSEV